MPKADALYSPYPKELLRSSSSPQGPLRGDEGQSEGSQEQPGVRSRDAPTRAARVAVAAASLRGPDWGRPQAADAALSVAEPEISTRSSYTQEGQQMSTY